MSIRADRLRRLLLPVAVWPALLAPTAAMAGDGAAGPYSLVAYVGGGYARYAVAPGGPPAGVPTDQSRSGFTSTVRVMWHPDHLLRLGLETGWTEFYSYSLQTSPGGELHLSAVPLIPIWSMEFFGVNIFFGGGYYYLNSHLDYQGTVDVRTWSLGWLAAASYVHPISENLGLAGELKWMNATEHEDGVLGLQVQLVWKFFEW